MTEVKNIKELRKYKKHLRKKIGEMEENFVSDLDYFQYGMKAAGLFKNIAGKLQLGYLMKLLVSRFGKLTRNIFSGIFKKAKGRPFSFILFMVATGLSFYYWNPGESGSDFTPDDPFAEKS